MDEVRKTNRRKGVKSSTKRIGQKKKSKLGIEEKF